MGYKFQLQTDNYLQFKTDILLPFWERELRRTASWWRLSNYLISQGFFSSGRLDEFSRHILDNWFSGFSDSGLSKLGEA